MRYDYVDIGTCDFDTAYDVALESERVLLVEPVEYYLDRIPDRPLQKKANVAISIQPGWVPVYYLPDVTIHMFDLPRWTRGCNSVGTRHPTIDALLLSENLPLNLVASKQIEVITFRQLCERFNITEIRKLKIDTEGHECFILPGVLEEIANGMQIDWIKFENQQALGNKPFLDSLVAKMVSSGQYVLNEVTAMDVTMERVR